MGPLQKFANSNGYSSFWFCYIIVIPFAHTSTTPSSLFPRSGTYTIYPHIVTNRLLMEEILRHRRLMKPYYLQNILIHSPIQQIAFSRQYQPHHVRRGPTGGQGRRFWQGSAGQRPRSRARQRRQRRQGRRRTRSRRGGHVPKGMGSWISLKALNEGNWRCLEHFSAFWNRRRDTRIRSDLAASVLDTPGRYHYCVRWGIEIYCDSLLLSKCNLTLCSASTSQSYHDQGATGKLFSINVLLTPFILDIV